MSQGYRPSCIVEGRPFSQPLGVFQGLTDAFSESSVVAQPFITKAARLNKRMQTERTAVAVMIPDELG